MQEPNAEGRHRLVGTCVFLGEQRVHIISPQAIPENNSLRPELGGPPCCELRRGQANLAETANGWKELAIVGR